MDLAADNPTGRPLTEDGDEALFYRVDAAASRIVRQGDDAREIRQDVLLKLWPAVRDLPEGVSGAWVRRVVLNAWRDRLRQRDWTSGSELVDRAPAPDLDPAHLAGLREDAARLWDAVARLPADEREALMLKQFGELTFAQAAQVLKTPVTTVKSRLWRALDRLRKSLKELDT